MQIQRPNDKVTSLLITESDQWPFSQSMQGNKSIHKFKLMIHLSNIASQVFSSMWPSCLQSLGKQWWFGKWLFHEFCLVLLPFFKCVTNMYDEMPLTTTYHIIWRLSFISPCHKRIIICIIEPMSTHMGLISSVIRSESRPETKKVWGEAADLQGSGGGEQ